MNVVPMIFDVALDQIRRDFIPHGPRKIPVLPKFSSPQLFLHFWKFLKYFTGRNTLQHPYYPGNRIPRWKTQEYMNMIRYHPHLLNFKTIILCNLQKYLLRLIPDIFSLNPYPILRRPYQVIFRIVDSVSSSSDTHEVSYTTFFLLSADAPFIPVHRTGFSGAILINGSMLPISYRNPLVSCGVIRPKAGRGGSSTTGSRHSSGSV